MRMRGFTVEGQEGVRVFLWNPESIWAKAGLHTGDRLISINSKPIATWAEMRGILGPMQIGDTARIEVQRASGPFITTVTVSGFQRPVVHLEELSNVSEKQRRLRDAWRRGTETAAR
jgi:serine protease DegQ